MSYEFQREFGDDGFAVGPPEVAAGTPWRWSSSSVASSSAQHLRWAADGAIVAQQSDNANRVRVWRRGRDPPPHPHPVSNHQSILPDRHLALDAAVDDRQADGHRGAAAGRAVDLDRAAVLLHNAVGDREAQAGAGGLAAAERALGGHKRLEDLVAQLGRNAAAGVGDAQLD